MAEHVFRHAAGCLIESPTLTTDAPVVLAPYRWVATVWPDPHQPDGWDFLEWERGERGWVLPFTLAVGDVIEFGVTWADIRRGIDGPTIRWFGWLDHATDRALIIHGPYCDPAGALAGARAVVDELRLCQLDAPGFGFVGPAL